MNKILALKRTLISYFSFRGWLHWAFLLCATSATFSRAEERSLPLTAAYVYYFTKFVEWPNKPEIKRICIASDNLALKAEFDKVVLKAGGTIEIVFDVTGHFDDPLRHCQLIYLTSDFQSQRYPLLVGQGTLLVVEQNMDFPEAAVQLVLVNNKLGFDINRRNAKQQGLDISAKLLGLAREVKD